MSKLITSWAAAMKVGVISILCSALLSATIAEARCGKAPLLMTEEYLRSWEIIAYGRVTKAHNNTAARHESFAVLTLEGAWQGDPPNPLRVYHSDSVHGYQFEEGASYLVFASRSEDRVVASFCAPSCRESECLHHLELLGDPVTRF